MADRKGYYDWKAQLYQWLGIKKWMCVLHACDDSVHVLPIADDMIHELHDCPCGPTPELNNYNVWLYTHHSLDGRERDEPKESSAPS